MPLIMIQIFGQDLQLWAKPIEGRIKCNVSRKKNCICCYSLLSLRFFLACLAKKHFSSIFSYRIAEALALREAYIWLLANNHRHVDIKSDVKVIIDVITSVFDTGLNLNTLFKIVKLYY